MGGKGKAVAQVAKSAAGNAGLDKVIAELTDDTDQAVHFVGFYKAVVDNEGVSDRLDNSLSGFAGKTAIVAVRIAVVLYCCRAWDQGRDAMSLVRARMVLPMYDEIIERRRADDETEPPPEAQYDDLISAYERAEASAARLSIRALRTDFYAHRILDSRDRRHPDGSGALIDNPTHAEIVAFAEATVDLVRRLNLLWHRNSLTYAVRIQRATARAREFWRLIPVLRDVEAIDA